MLFSKHYLSLSGDERQAMADEIGASPEYLWQLASGWQGRKPSITMMQRICDADKRFHMAGLMEEFHGIVLRAKAKQ